MGIISSRRHLRERSVWMMLLVMCVFSKCCFTHRTLILTSPMPSSWLPRLDESSSLLLRSAYSAFCFICREDERSRWMYTIKENSYTMLKETIKSMEEGLRNMAMVEV